MTFIFGIVQMCRYNWRDFEQDETVKRNQALATIRMKNCEQRARGEYDPQYDLFWGQKYLPNNNSIN